MTRIRKILVADDDPTMRLVLSQALVRAGYEVRATGAASTLLKWAQAGEGDLVLSDVVMPDDTVFNIVPQILRARPKLPIILISGQSTLHTAVAAAAVGVLEYFPKPFDIEEVLAAVRRGLTKPGPSEASIQARAQSSERFPLCGRSPAMQEVYRTLAQLVRTELTVLLYGESGTGKDLAARALHDLGKRKSGRFVVAHLAATPRSRVETDLFGDDSRPGKLAEADGGTLYLDEVGDLPPDAQTRLLRVIDGSERGFNAQTGRQASPRLIVSTNKDLRSLIAQGLFREDLFFRLNVASMRMPPLRERLDDVPELAHVFLLRAAREGLMSKGIETAALDRLQRHTWPGNIRELENMILRVVALSSEDVVSARSIHRELSEQAMVPAPETSLSLETLIERRLAEEFVGGSEHLPPPGLYERVISDVGRPLLRLTLAATRGNQVRAAEVLGLNRNTLKKKLRQLGMPTMRADIVRLQPDTGRSSLGRRPSPRRVLANGEDVPG